MSLAAHRQCPEVADEVPELWKVVLGPWELVAAVTEPSAWEVPEHWVAVAAIPVPLLLVGSGCN